MNGELIFKVPCLECERLIAYETKKHVNVLDGLNLRSIITIESVHYCTAPKRIDVVIDVSGS